MIKLRPIIWCPVVFAAGAFALTLIGMLLLALNYDTHNAFFTCGAIMALAGLWPGFLLLRAGVEIEFNTGWLFSTAIWALIGLGVGALVQRVRRRKPA